MMTQQRQRTLKGVIPPKNPEPNGLLEALRRLREFVKQYPGLDEEVMKLREQQQLQELRSDGHSLAYRN